MSLSKGIGELYCTGKRILFFALPILLSIIVLGRVNTATAMTLEEIEVGDEIKITGKGEGTCTDAAGEPGTANARVRYQMLVQETTEDGFSGIARADLAVKSTCADDIVLKKFGPLNFSYDANTCEMSITKPHHDGIYNFCSKNLNPIFDEDVGIARILNIEGTLNHEGQQGEEFILNLEGKALYEEYLGDRAE